MSKNRVEKILHNPAALFLTLGIRGYFNWMPDEQYLRIAYRCKMHKKLNLDTPQTFNEKLQWLKLHDRKPEYTLLADKYEAKKLVAQRIGEEYIIPTLGVWNSFDEIDFDKLPSQFVLKCTHDSGSIVICKDKSSLNKEHANRVLSNGLKHNSFWAAREWPYKGITPRVIAEVYMEDSITKDLRDYKFFAFDGTVKAMFIATERGSKEETKFDFFDENFNHLPFTNGHPNATELPKKPDHFEEMKTLAEKLSTGIPQVRVDFYECNGKIYFGEMTFYHWGGMVPFQPEEWDYTFGSWIELPKNEG